MSIGEAWSSFMGSLNKKQAFDLLDAYVELGGNFIDTANGYQSGESETWIGEWMKEREADDIPRLPGLDANKLHRRQSRPINHSDKVFLPLQSRHWSREDTSEQQLLGKPQAKHERLTARLSRQASD